MPLIQWLYVIIPHKPWHCGNMHATVSPHFITIFSLWKGLHNVCNKSEEAVNNELLKLHLRVYFNPQDPNQMTGE